MSLTLKRLLRFGEFELDPKLRSLTRRGERVAISPKTFDVLSVLVQRHGSVVTKEELLSEVWPDSFVEESNLTQHIFWIRKLLGDASYVLTLSGRGYQFVLPVEEVSSGDGVVAAEPGPDPQPSPLVPVRAIWERNRARISIHELMQRPKRRWLLLSVTGITLAVVGIAIGLAISTWRGRAVPGDHHTVVLAEMEDNSNEPDLGKALRTLVGMDLAQSPYFIVASDSDVRRTLKRMEQSPDEDLKPEVSREVCQRLNDQAVLSGMVARFDRKYLVTLSASDCANGKTLLQTRATASSRDGLMEAIDAATAEIRKRLGEPMDALKASGLTLEPVHTFSLEALKAYSQGREAHVRLHFAEAIPFYQHALQLDPNFAAAWAQIANCHINTGDTKLAQDDMAKAYALRDHAEGTDRIYITTMYDYWKDGDRHQAIRNYEDWTRTYPNSARAWDLLAEFRHATGDMHGAIDAAKHGYAIIQSTNMTIDYSRFLLLGGRLEDAKAIANTGIAHGIDAADLHSLLRDVAYLQHDAAGFDAQNQWFATKAEDSDRDDAAASLDLSEGKVKAALALWQKQMEATRKAGFEDGALQKLAEVVQLEAELGLKDDARRKLATFANLPAMKLNLVASAEVIMAKANVGDIAGAEKDFAFMREHNPHDSDVLEFWTPEIATTLALARHQPQEALAAIQPAIPYEPSYADVSELRGESFLAAGKPDEASSEFRVLIDHPYGQALSETVPLAHLGLARSLVQSGNLAAARAEYDTFFKLWASGDADLPVLVQARAEFAKLK